LRNHERDEISVRRLTFSQSSSSRTTRSMCKNSSSSLSWSSACVAPRRRCNSSLATDNSSLSACNNNNNILHLCTVLLLALHHKGSLRCFTTLKSKAEIFHLLVKLINTKKCITVKSYGTPVLGTPVLGTCFGCENKTWAVRIWVICRDTKATFSHINGKLSPIPFKLCG